MADNLRADVRDQVEISRNPPSLEELLSAGKWLHRIIPRNDHASWKATDARGDLLLTQADKACLEDLLSIKYGRMRQSPFAFFGESAAIMPADLATTPATGLRVQPCGDCHLATYAILVSLAYATLAGQPPQVGVHGYLLGGGYALLR